jgi:hypothetical protein
MTDLVWVAKHPQFTPNMLGYIPSFLREADERSAREQINSGYIGKWHPMGGFTMLANGNLKYPGDPPTQLLAETTMRGETIRFYDYAWVAIIQPDGSFEVARLD